MAVASSSTTITCILLISQKARWNKWLNLTDKIKQNAWRDEDGKPDDYIAKLLRDRRALLETASGKIPMLKALLKDEDTRGLKHTLVYTSDKGPDQLDNVNRLLRDKNILFHQLTAEETASRNKTKQIINSFQNGEIQVLTAKRVLDEGVNIPQICKAFILASTTVGRQWVQRRGRLLRTCNTIGKTHSIIHDLLALPPRDGGRTRSRCTCPCAFRVTSRPRICKISKECRPTKWATFYDQ